MMIMMLILVEFGVDLEGIKGGFSEFFDDDFGVGVTAGGPPETVVEKAEVFVEEF